MSLVSPEWLAQHVDDPQVRICDVRWYLPMMKKDGATEYAAGHIPHAVFVDLDRDLSAPDDGSAGRHPLPDSAAFGEAVRRLGVSPSTHVVAYDDMGGAIAARLWWLLRAHGHAQVSLLDGGITRWKAEGRPVTAEVATVAPGSFAPNRQAGGAVTLDEMRAAHRAGALVLDARTRERYTGEKEPVEPKPGHIPGAVSAPLVENLQSGSFLPVDVLRSRLQALAGGSRDVIVSCGSGVTACHMLFALDLTGVRPFPSAKLFVGSFSEWSRRNLPIATGSEPGSPV